MALAAGTLLYQSASRAADQARSLPPPAVDCARRREPHRLETVILAGGCFWGVQGVFEHVRGVKALPPATPAARRTPRDYETRQHRHHRPRRIRAGRLRPGADLLRRDPADLLLGGPRPDRGEPSGARHGHAIPLGNLHHHARSRRTRARAYIAQLDAAHVFSRPIATRITPVTGFYPAETYHQDYLVRHPDNPYIAINDLPKVRALQRLFPDFYLEQPVLVLHPPA